MVITGTMIVLAFVNQVPADVIKNGLDAIYANSDLQLAGIIYGGIFIITGIIVPYRLLKAIHRNKLITFQNPDGEVTVSIYAIEDYVRKVIKSMSDINSARAYVTYGRKGINIVSEITIGAGSNVSAITERIQMEVKSKVQAMLGVDEKIEISIRINKIFGEVEPGELVPAQKPEAVSRPYQYL